MSRTKLQPREYAPGHFSAPARAWFGENWQPQGEFRSTHQLREAGARARERACESGEGWGTGGMGLLSRRGEAFQGRRPK